MGVGLKCPAPSFYFWRNRMGKLVELLRWKRKIQLSDGKGSIIRGKDGKPLNLWLRVLGDEDQQQAYRLARVHSAMKRALLRDKESLDYKDEILPISEADIDICKELVKISKRTQFQSDALSNVERPDLPEMDEIAVDADAPSLEDQEKLDKMVEDIEKEYQKAINDYIDTRVKELAASLETMEDEQIRSEAMFETSNALALNSFMTEVIDEKVWRSVYMDEKCTQRAFDGVQDYRDLPSDAKEQLSEAYQALEMSPDDLKN